MWILREIERVGGEVDFRRFMEVALYHPVHGYYCRETSPIGREGDFLTAPAVSPWYGAVFARVLDELARRSGTALHLVDLASSDGGFIASVIGALADSTPRVLRRVTAVERSPVMRRQARDRLARAGVTVECVDAVPAGLEQPVVVHASELYDAMPVHRVEAAASGLQELTVVTTDDGLNWGRRPAGEELQRYFADHGVELEPGQLAEANLEAGPFHQRVLGAAVEGVALVLDYGYPASKLYDPRGRGRGSLVSYHRHRVGRELLEEPGRRDLTAHVNFDDLRRAADGCGWSEVGLMPLAEFLVRARIGELLDERGFGIEAELDAAAFTARQEVKQLLDPEGMGADLKMLVQGKGRLGEIAAEVLARDP